MEDTVYWDTSALLKLYAAEADSSDYLRLLISQPGDVAVSYLHRVELYYGLCAKEARGEIQTGSAKTLYASFESHIKAQRYFEIPWGSDVAEQAHSALDTSLSASPPIGLRTLGGLHLGAMLVAKVTSLVTADNRMRDAAARLGITCIDPQSSRQRIVLSPADFTMKEESLEAWEDLDIVISLPGGMQWDELGLRDLKWIKP